MNKSWVASSLMPLFRQGSAMTLKEIAKHTGKAVLLCIIAFLATESKAQAYLDPGSGSYATQILIASVAGGLFAIKNLIARFIKPNKNILKSKSVKKDNS